MELLSIRQYAKRRECHPSYIGKLIKLGKIPLTEGKINPVQADEALARNTRPRPGATKPKSAPSEKVAVGSTSAQSVESDELLYAVELARLTRAKADAAEMANHVTRGELVNREEFERASAEFDELLKRRISGVPTKLAPRLAGQTATQAYAILDTEMRELLAEFNRGDM